MADRDPPEVDDRAQSQAQAQRGDDQGEGALPIPPSDATTATTTAVAAPALPRNGDGSNPQLTASSRTQSTGGIYLSNRRLSSSVRIGGILETARERAASMGQPGSASPNMGPMQKTKSSNGFTLDANAEESSADESTRIMSRANTTNYTGLRPAPSHSSSGARARRTATRDSARTGQLAAASTMEQREPGKSEPSWLKTQIDRFQSIELENKGSVARDHLAIERTFLAWLRTSLAFASIGIAVTQLFRLNQGSAGGSSETLRHIGKPLGTTFLAISILILFLGYKRYFQAQHWVMQGKFPASRGTIAIVAFVAFAIMLASLVVVIVMNPVDTQSATQYAAPKAAAALVEGELGSLIL